VLQRERTGTATSVSASLLGAALLTASETMLRDGQLLPIAQLDAGQTGLSPGYGIHRCADGWVAVAATQPDQLAALERDIPGLTGLPVPRAVEQLTRAGVPAEVVREGWMDSFLDDPVNQRCGLAMMVEHADWGGGEYVGFFWEFPDLRSREHAAPPALGQDMVDVLGELGSGDEEIDALLRSGVVMQRSWA
jgi:crotonobetainyl-CoA:carnitine CoA-transferase CaiB-like acyl-CoA transferase